MTNVAILGFGVVGGGVARLLTNNKKETLAVSGDEINIKYILDLRDFPGSPFGDKVIHDYSVIVNDPEVDTVIEVMGGSHPAYEYTVAALKAGKNVITSNKEVVANFGDEFLAIAKEYGVSYRFEAAVGGGIPVISPIIGCVRHNKISEVRGILNGTTNYILTKMFTLGDSFEDSLKDAQERGYAERNPDADILGTDASRKIAILAALTTGSLTSPDLIPTEGITGIRAQDVKTADGIGHKIKLLGRCIIPADGQPYVMVAPFLLPDSSPLSGVCGVFNAVEVIGDPIGDVMFYGPGAGAGSTASAVVGDLMQIMCSGTSCATPVFEKSTINAKERMKSFACRTYLAFDKSAKDRVEEVLKGSTPIDCDNEYAVITEEMTESALDCLISTIGSSPLSRIRFL